jgi:hypothetical protein
MRFTAKEISDTIIAQIETELNQTVPLFPKAFNRVIAKAFGLVYVVLFQFSNFIFAQMFISTASDKDFTVGGIKVNPLQMWGDLVGLQRIEGERFESDFLINTIVQGGTLLSGSQVVNPETEEVYLTVGDTALTGPQVTATIRAVNYSASANVIEGTVMAFVSAPSDVKKNGTVSTINVVGGDPETTEEFRARQLQWWSARPQGGAYADYREWGMDASPDVKWIGPFSGGTTLIPSSGAGQVDVYVESKTATDGIADAALLEAVYDNIELTADSGLANRRPINAFVNTASIQRIEIDVIIAGLTSPDVPATQAKVEDAVENYLLQRENYILGLSVLPRKDIISRTELGGIVGRVVASQGGTVSTVTTLFSAVAFDVKALLEGQKSKTGTVTWS